MGLLLDTHALLWWLAGDARLAGEVRQRVSNVDVPVWVSAATAWEVATKVRIGKLPDAAPWVRALPELLVQVGMQSLPVTLGHALAAGALPGPHRDPFDRMLIAQARAEGLHVVTRDPVFAAYGVDVLW